MALPGGVRRCLGSFRAFSAYRLAATARPGHWAELGPPASLGPAALTRARPPVRFCSGDERSRQQRRISKLGMIVISNPLIWLRNKFYDFTIRVLFDHEFSIEEFTRGAKHAFAHVSKLLSECKLDLLEEFVSEEVFQMLKENLSSLSQNHRNALAADINEILYTTTTNIGLYHDKSGRNYVCIMMRFWYLTSTELPDATAVGTKIFWTLFGDETEKTPKQILSAIYEFRREFTEEVKPEWIITQIEYPRLLD
uniref:Matrix AAA peptidase interacting protein 1 n=1 Tax=Pelusios castaneus TaxID=367368 RepID=A0A8C8RS18_9SAUR